MKTLLLFLLGSTLSLTVLAESSSLSLAISLPALQNGTRALDQARTASFFVILSNGSDRPQRIWAPWSDLGSATLSLETTDQTGKTRSVKRAEGRSLSHKLSEFCILKPRESLIFEVHHADTNAWENFPKAGQGLTPISMRAVFEVRTNTATDLHGIWTGKIYSESLRVTIYPWEPR